MVPKTPTDQPEGKPDERGPQEEGTQEDLGPSLYEAYRPQLLRVEGAQAHKTPLVESSAMSAVHPPTPTYAPHLSPDVVERGILSEAQLESLVYAGQAHQAFLPASGGTEFKHGMDVYSPKGEAHRMRKDAGNAWSLIGSDGDVVQAFTSPEQGQEFLSRAKFTDAEKLPVKEHQAMRRGYFVGDGTGVGKGREIAGIISDNINQGRRKHVWVSQKQDLISSAKRDWIALGQDAKHLHHFDKIRHSETPPAEGVCFITYDTLKGKSTGEDNIDKLARWLGPDFDGVIAFDESHEMANAIQQKGKRGKKDASKVALAGIKLQQMFPKARITYVSATGATEVANLAYAERLGLWGRGTSFADKAQFIDQMNKGGVAAMEAVAQSLKAMGGYSARSLSFDDGTPEGQVKYDRVTHHLDGHQMEQYDSAATSWQHVLTNIGKALEMTGGSDDKNAKTAARSQFWGAQQRFFNQVMTAMQTPAVIRAMEDDLAGITRHEDGTVTKGEPRSPVVQLVNTNEAAMERALAGREDDQELEDLDLSPKEVLMNYLKGSFPVNRIEAYTDEAGNELYREVRMPVYDENGRPILDVKGHPVTEPVQDPEAVALRDELLTMANSLRMTESPMDMIIRHFGYESVAEATGREQRFVWKINEKTGQPEKHLDKRGSHANSADASAFQGGKKKILIFSDAGGTGSSYHADRDAANQQQRVHYMLQPGWRADNAVQGLGRTHRTNQASAPQYRLVEIDDLPAQKRFISTIARRLDQLGALTKGQRQAGGGGLFDAADNLESPEARVAMNKFFRDLQADKCPGLNHEDVITQLGLKKPEPPPDNAGRGRGRGRAKKQPPPPEPDSMGQFLNRMLCLKVDMQQRVFDAYDERLKQTVDQAKRDGTLDTGVENFPAAQITKKSDNTVYADPATGAEVRHIVTTAKTKAEKTRWGDLITPTRKPLAFVTNKQSGRVYAVYQSADKTDPTTGQVTSQYKIIGPTRVAYIPASDYEGYYGKYNPVEEADAMKQWNEEYAAAPDFHENEEHFLAGALLPIWNRIPGEKPKIYRLKTDDGHTVVGRHVPRKMVPDMMKNLGVAYQDAGHAPAELHRKLEAGTAHVTLANGWRLKPARVQNEKRIEILPGRNYGQDISRAAAEELRADGVIVQNIQYQNRFFVPTGAEGAKVLERILKHRPVADVEESPDQHARSPLAIQYIRLAHRAAAWGDHGGARVFMRQAREVG